MHRTEDAWVSPPVPVAIAGAVGDGTEGLGDRGRAMDRGDEAAGDDGKRLSRRRTSPDHRDRLQADRDHAGGCAAPAERSHWDRGSGWVACQGLPPVAEASRRARRPVGGPGDAAAEAVGKGAVSGISRKPVGGPDRPPGTRGRGGRARPGRFWQRTQAVQTLSGPGGNPGVRGAGAPRGPSPPVAYAPRGASPRPKGARAWSGGRVEDREIGLYTLL